MSRRACLTVSATRKHTAITLNRHSSPLPAPADRKGSAVELDNRNTGQRRARPCPEPRPRARSAMVTHRAWTSPSDRSRGSSQAPHVSSRRSRSAIASPSTPDRMAALGQLSAAQYTREHATTTLTTERSICRCSGESSAGSPHDEGTVTIPRTQIPWLSRRLWFLPAMDHLATTGLSRLALGAPLDRWLGRRRLVDPACVAVSLPTLSGFEVCPRRSHRPQL